MLEQESKIGNKVSFLKEQLKLATDPSISVYISASAGSGKTTLLINRILRLALQVPTLSNILCIAFTNAAAYEIKNRLYTKMARWMKDKDILISELEALQGQVATEEQIVKAQSLFSRFLDKEYSVRIQTLHSFCLSILSSNHLLQDITLDSNTLKRSNILGPSERKKLFTEAFDEVMSNEAISDLILARLIKQYDLITIKAMLDTAISLPVWQNISSVEDVYQRCSSVIGVGNLREREHRYNTSASSEPISILIENYYISNQVNLREMLEVIDIEEGIIIKEWFQNIKNFEKFQAYSLVFLQQNFKPRVRIKTRAKSNYINALIASHAQELVKIWQKINMQRNFDLLYDFSLIAKLVRERFIAKKEELGLLEYDDLLYKALYLLKTEPTILHHLDRRVDHILIDEAQDLSPIQWQIIQAITEEFYAGEGAKACINRSLFIVGDYKQSIFSFQGADPVEFLKAKNFYRKASQEAQKSWHELKLLTCYRCPTKVLALVNNIGNNLDLLGTKIEESGNIFEIPEQTEEIFKREVRVKNEDQIFTKPVIFCAFSPTLRHREAEWFIPTIKDPEDNQSKSMQLANFISSKVLDILSQGNKSILILFRKRSELMRDLTTLLSTKGITVEGGYGASNLLLWDLLALAKFVLYPFDDLNLACLLKSPFIGLDEEQLFLLCHGRDRPLWENIRLMSNRKQELWIQDLYQKLYTFFSLSRSLAYDFYLEFMLSEVYTNVINCYNQAGKAEALLETFLIQINKYHESGIGGGSLQGFIAWAEDREDEFTANLSNDFSYYNTAELNQKVRITTVHSAKGLESEVVILADASYTDNIPYETIILEDNWFVINVNSEIACPNLLKIKEKRKIARKAEDMRLLYVAITRAKKNLYIIKDEVSKGGWAELLEIYDN